MEVGEYTVDIPLNVNADAEAEGTETVTIEYLYVNLCGDSVFRQSTLLIEDFEPTELDYVNPVGICNGEAVLRSRRYPAMAHMSSSGAPAPTTHCQ